MLCADGTLLIFRDGVLGCGLKNTKTTTPLVLTQSPSPVPISGQILPVTVVSVSGTVSVGVTVKEVVAVPEAVSENVLVSADADVIDEFFSSSTTTSSASSSTLFRLDNKMREGEDLINSSSSSDDFINISLTNIIPNNTNNNINNNTNTNSNIMQNKIENLDLNQNWPLGLRILLNNLNVKINENNENNESRLNNLNVDNMNVDNNENKLIFEVIQIGSWKIKISIDITEKNKNNNSDQISIDQNLEKVKNKLNKNKNEKYEKSKIRILQNVMDLFNGNFSYYLRIPSHVTQLGIYSDGVNRNKLNSNSTKIDTNTNTNIISNGNEIEEILLEAPALSGIDPRLKSGLPLLVPIARKDDLLENELILDLNINENINDNKLIDDDILLYLEYFYVENTTTTMHM